MYASNILKSNRTDSDAVTGITTKVEARLVPGEEQATMTTVTTSLLVADYIKHRLHMKSLTWPSCPYDLTTTPNTVQNCMRQLGEEFEQRYTKVSSVPYGVSVLMVGDSPPQK